jgi:Spy/CpxP family protein refolding chaperone
LKLTAEQRQKLQSLQKDVDGQLEKILTAEQRQQLRKLGQGGPAGFGPPSGSAPPPGGLRRFSPEAVPGAAGAGGGPAGPPQPVQVLPTFVQEQLRLSDEQRKQLKALQEEVDGRLAKILTAEQQQQVQKFGPPQGGPGGFGGPGGEPSRAGQVLPTFVQEPLKLTEAQRLQLAELQSEVDARLTKILTARQQQQLQQSGPGGGPGGFGPPGGAGGFGARGGFGPPRGPRAVGGPPQVGQVLSLLQQNELRLNDAQRRQVKELQRTVDTRLAKILTADQRRQLPQLGRRGPGGPDGFGLPGF